MGKFAATGITTLTDTSTPEYDQQNYTEMYDYDFNSTCEQDVDAATSESVMVLYYVFFGLGLLGNATVLWLLLRYIKLKTMTDVCLLNLALSDLILAVTLPLWAYNSPNLASCKIMTGVYELGFYSGALFVTLMSADRYLAIVHAVKAMQTRKLRYGITASIAIWIISVTLAAPQVIFASLEIDLEYNSTQCVPLYPLESQLSWKMLRNFSENTVGLFVCLPIIVFCYVSILVVLSKSKNSKRARAIKLIFAIVCVFLVCWVPYNVTIFLQTLQLLEYFDTCAASKNIVLSLKFTEIIALGHCFLNPVIYALVGEKFRYSLRTALNRCLGRPQSIHVSKDTTDKETSNTLLRSEY